jgi:DNA-binding CsgD family transcriptional regulator
MEQKPIKLSSQQKEIIYLISCLKKNSEIAELMRKTPQLIAVSVSQLEDKLHCVNRNELLINSILLVQEFDDYDLSRVINLYGPSPYSFKLVKKELI